MSVVCTLLHANRCCVVCSVCLQRGHSGEVCVVGSILWRYDSSIGDFPVLSCASMRLSCLCSVSSSLEISGACLFMILFMFLFCMYVCTVCVCIVLMFCLILSSVAVAGSRSMLRVYVLFLKVVCFCRRAVSGCSVM